MSNQRLKSIDSVAETRILPASQNRNHSLNSSSRLVSANPQRLPLTQLIGSKRGDNDDNNNNNNNISNFPAAAVALAGKLRSFDYLSKSDISNDNSKFEINNNNNTASQPVNQPLARMSNNHMLTAQQRKLSSSNAMDSRNHSATGSTGTAETGATMDSSDTLQSGPKAPLLPQPQVMSQQQHHHNQKQYQLATANNMSVSSGQKDSRRAPLRKQEAADLEAQALDSARYSAKQFAGLSYVDGGKSKTSTPAPAATAKGLAKGEFLVENVSIEDTDEDDDDDEDPDEQTQTDATSESGEPSGPVMQEKIQFGGHAKLRSSQPDLKASKQHPGSASAGHHRHHSIDASKAHNSKHSDNKNQVRQQQAHSSRISFNENYRAPSYQSNNTTGGSHHNHQQQQHTNSKTNHNNNSHHTNSSNRKMDWLDNSGGYNSYDSAYPNRNTNKHEHKIAMIDGSYSSGGSFYPAPQKSSKGHTAYMLLKSIVLLLLTLLLIMVLSGMILAGHYLPKMMNDLLAAPRTFNVTIAG